MDCLSHYFKDFIGLMVQIGSMEANSFLLEPACEPGEVCALPEDSVLGLQYPVVLIGIEEEFSLDATHTGSIEGTHALCGIDAVVFLAVDAEDRSVPLVDEEMWGIAVGAVGIGGAVFVPVSIVVLPVGEPVLLSLGVHGFEVEGTVVGDEALEALVVVAGEVVDAESAEGGSDTAEAVAVDIGQGVAGIVNGAEIVAHALTSPVAGDLLQPLLTEAGKTAAIGSNDDIALRSHDVEIPAVGPELGNRRLWATFAEEQGGVLLCGVEVRRLDDPVEELLPVGGGAPAGL